MGHIGRRILVSLTPKPWASANLSFRAVCLVLGKVLCFLSLHTHGHDICKHTSALWTQGHQTADSPHETVTLEASMPPCGSLDESQTVGGDCSFFSQLPRPTAPWQYFSSWRTLYQLPSRAQLLPTALAYPLMCFLLLPPFKEPCCYSTILMLPYLFPFILLQMQCLPSTLWQTHQLSIKATQSLGAAFPNRSSRTVPTGLRWDLLPSDSLSFLLPTALKRGASRDIMPYVLQMQP